MPSLIREDGHGLFLVSDGECYRPQISAELEGLDDTVSDFLVGDRVQTFVTGQGSARLTATNGNVVISDPIREVWWHHPYTGKGRAATTWSAITAESESYWNPPPNQKHLAASAVKTRLENL
jgi:hypothetical protein